MLVIIAMAIQNLLARLVATEAARAAKAAVSGDKVYFVDNPGGAAIGLVAGAAAGEIYAAGDPNADWIANPGQPTGEIKQQYDLKNTAGDTEISVVVTDEVDGTPAQNAATQQNLAAMQADPIGELAVEALAEVAKESLELATDLATYQGTEPYQQKAMRDLVKGTPVTVSEDLKKEINRQISPQDSSRVSKEYHEYKYCLHTSWYWADGVLSFADPLVSITYIGPGAGGIPTFGEWVDLPDLRELFKIYRRYNRAASACGGKALWEFQGHPSKKVAVNSYVYNEGGGPPNSYSAARDALISASPNFTA